MILNKAKSLMIKAFMGGEWEVAYRERNCSGKRYQLVEAPAGTCIADPFLYEANGEHYLFVEFFKKKENKACITYYRFIDDKPVYQGKIIDQPYHMSYPCVFSCQGEHYMIPETSANQSMDLYKAVHFPNQWEKVACLSSGTRYVDTTVLKQEDGFKLVTYRKDGGSWYLDAFALDMEAKKLKPLSSKKYNTNIGRPAGSFIVGDDLVRPAQNCARKYGESIILYQVDQFEDGHFEEHEKSRIEVSKLPMDVKADRIHTYNQDSKYECVDVYFEKLDLLHGVKTLWRAYLRKFLIKE